MSEFNCEKVLKRDVRCSQPAEFEGFCLDHAPSESKLFDCPHCVGHDYAFAIVVKKPGARFSGDTSPNRIHVFNCPTCGEALEIWRDRRGNLYQRPESGRSRDC